MAYRTEVLQRARARLAQAKADRESENQEHLARAYALVPRLREIDIQLRRTMVLAAQAAFTQGIDAQEAMNKVRQANLALQQERAALVAENFEEGYLDDSPVCSTCGGTGYVGSQMCECLRELCRQEQRKELTILSGGKESFGQFRLDYYPDRYDPKYGASPRTIMERNFQNCRRYASTFSMNASATASIVSPSTRTPALKSIQPDFFWDKGVFVATLIVGAGPPTGVPRPVVKSTTCAPAAQSAVIAHRSLPGP